MPVIPDAVLALDVGSVRIGVAIASMEARLPRPLTTLTADDTVLDRLRTIIAAESVSTLVVGLPRNLSGDDTPQTAAVRRFAETLASLRLPFYFQDEALTSRQAEAELAERGKPYSKGDIDALAATYILHDWLAAQSEASTGSK